MYPTLSHVLPLPQILSKVVTVLGVVTVREANNLGIFLKEVFRIVMHWRSSEKVWRDVWGKKEMCHSI